MSEQTITATVGPTLDQDLQQALNFMRIWITDDAHLGESAISYELEKAEGLRNLEAIEQAIAATVGVGRCHYIPDDVGFTWWDENDVEHYEDDSASDECDSASCDKCGYSMMVGEEGWFDGWDEITEWTEEDGSEHKGYVLKPRFKFCPKCGARVVSE